MPQPEGTELEEVRARRERLRDKYLRPRGERPHTTVQGVHHLALICRDVRTAPSRFDEAVEGATLREAEGAGAAGS